MMMFLILKQKKKQPSVYFSEEELKNISGTFIKDSPYEWNPIEYIGELKDGEFKICFLVNNIDGVLWKLIDVKIDNKHKNIKFKKCNYFE